MTSDTLPAPVDLSIVTSLYNSGPYLVDFCSRAVAAARLLTPNFEIILVNDGSPDDSLSVALRLRRDNPRIVVVDLARNYGQHKALMTGLAYARGGLVFVLDSDLEEAPELLRSFHAEMQRTGADVVYGVQSTRKGSLIERVTGDLFYRFFNWAAAEKVPRNMLCARLMSARYVANLIRHQEREVFLQGLWLTTGFKQVPVVSEKGSKGRSSYSLVAKLRILVNAITSFSNRPLVAIFYLGTLISLLALVAAVDLIVRRLFYGTMLTGWPSLIVSVWFLGGLTIFCLGVIGIYLSKIFMEVKGRPYSVVREVHSGSGHAEHEALTSGHTGSKEAVGR